MYTRKQRCRQYSIIGGGGGGWDQIHKLLGPFTSTVQKLYGLFERPPPQQLLNELQAEEDARRSRIRGRFENIATRQRLLNRLELLQLEIARMQEQAAAERKQRIRRQLELLATRKRIRDRLGALRPVITQLREAAEAEREAARLAAEAKREADRLAAERAAAERAAKKAAAEEATAAKAVLDAELRKLELKTIASKVKKSQTIPKIETSQERRLAEAKALRNIQIARQEREAAAAKAEVDEQERKSVAAAAAAEKERAEAAAAAQEAKEKAERERREAEETARREAERLEEERLAAAAAAEAAAKEAAAAEAARQLMIIQQRIEKISTFEQQIATKPSVFLRNKHLQQYLFKFLSELDRILYRSPRALMELQEGLPQDIIVHFQGGPAVIKENLYRFFVKGGAAPVLLYDKKSEDGVYHFTNDIDTIILINPELSNENYDRLHANLIKVIMNFLEQFIIQNFQNGPSGHTNIPNELYTAIRTLFEQPFKHSPRVIKYTGGRTPEKADEQLGPALNALADLYANGVFRLHQQYLMFVNNISALVTNEATITAEIAQLQREITHINTQITEAYNRLMSAAVGNPQENYYNYQKLLSEKQPKEYKVSVLQSSLALVQESLGKFRTQVVALDDTFRDPSLLTFDIYFNYGYVERPAAGVVPPAAASAAAAAAPAALPVIFLNETLIALKPNSKHDHIKDLLDIVIPLKSNKFLADDWRYWSVKRVTPLEGVQFDVSDPVYTLFDQNRAARGSVNVAHLADKLMSRVARRNYLQAQIETKLNEKNKNTQNALAKLDQNVRERIMGPLGGGRHPKNRRTMKRVRKHGPKN